MNQAAREAIYKAQDAIEEAMWAFSQENCQLREDLEWTQKRLKEVEKKLAEAETKQKTVSQAKIDATSEILEMFVNNRAAFDEAVRIYVFAEKLKEEERKKKEEEERRKEEEKERNRKSQSGYRGNWHHFKFSDYDAEDFDEFYERFHEDFFGRKWNRSEGPFGSKQGPRPSSGGADSWWIVLEVERSACEAVIKKSYRSLAMKYHPDNRDTGDETKMKSVNRAMEQARAEKGFK